MAMIHCSECDRVISDQASTCPGCGAPVQTAQINDRKQDDASDKKPTYIAGVIATVFGLASLFMPYFAAVFFIPIALVSGIIAFFKDEIALGIIGISFALMGLYFTVNTAMEISNSLEQLDKSLENIAPFEFDPNKY